MSPAGIANPEGDVEHGAGDGDGVGEGMGDRGEARGETRAVPGGSAAVQPATASSRARVADLRSANCESRTGRTARVTDHIDCPGARGCPTPHRPRPGNPARAVGAFIPGPCYPRGTAAVVDDEVAGGVG